MGFHTVFPCSLMEIPDFPASRFVFTNPPYKRNTALSELARAMHDGKSIHEIHVKFRNSENTYDLFLVKNLKISYNDENLYQQPHVQTILQYLLIEILSYE